MDGVLVIDKPAGPTSHDVVAAIRKALKEKKVGHTGTLDPAATGVLPLVLGRATKIARYLTGGHKRYLATIRLGITTDTLDGEGEVLSERPVAVDEAQLRQALGTFVGTIEQLPPMFSAKKVEGKRLYELAREGKEIEREAKRVRVDHMDLVRFDADSHELVVDVRCSAGTYVRVLAQDIGEMLGCGGYLHALRRTEAGPFDLRDAIPLADAIADPPAAKARLLPMERALGELPRIDVPASMARLIVNGHQLTAADLDHLDLPDFAADDAITLGVEGGGLVAIARTLVAKGELVNLRRDERGVKTERVLHRD